ncbi:hypothetical protein [Shewanella sp. GXUN23E]|uniref:hypothetical protein n=1 Tax=Shewanella sp. GXUN23E TaxID=3422498 RepID=UPI003D7C3D7B
MKRLHRFLLLSALLITALVCYLFGQLSGALGFLVLGIGMEILFWMQLFTGNKPERK